MSTPQIVIDAHYLRKQRLALDAILAENQRLKEELMLGNKYSVNPTTQATTELIAQLKTQAETYEHQITNEQQNHAKLQARDAELKETILELKQQMGGVNNSLEKSIRAQRLVIILEHRVQHANARRSEASLKRSRLQEAVDGYRRERLLFDELTRKTEKSIEKRAQESASIISKAAEIHEERMKAAAMKAQVRARAEKDVAACEAEWSRLTSVIEIDRKQKEEQRQREKQERNDRFAAIFRRDYTTPKRDTLAGGNSTSGSSTRPADPPSATPLQEKIRVLKDALEEVKKSTGASCAEELAEWVGEKRSENVSLFTRVTEAHGRIEDLEKRIKELRKEVEQVCGRSPEALAAATASAERTAMYQNTLQEATQREAQVGKAHERVNQLCAIINDLHQKLDCISTTDSSSSAKGGGGKSTIPPPKEDFISNNNADETTTASIVTERTVLQYLGIIEQRATDIVKQYVALATEDGKLAAERVARVLSPVVAALPPLEYASLVDPPSTLSSSNESERTGKVNAKVNVEDEKPLLRADLKEKSAKAVAESLDY